MNILRTPDEQFVDLPDYPFEPHYLDIPADDGSTLRLHYVDEGQSDAPPVLLMHGEPSWSFLYRKMIPILTAAGLRAIAPDLIGFGRSDKLAQREDYTYQRHVDWMTHFLVTLNLQKVTLFCQDWGGLIGLRLVAEQPDRFARVVAANTGLPTGDQPMPDAFYKWQEISQKIRTFNIGQFVSKGCHTSLAPEVEAAYNAPFPDESYKAGARIFPMLVPSSPDDPATKANRRAWRVLSKWDKPFLTAFSDGDPITRGAEVIFQKLIPGAKGLTHPIIADGGHFLQEDKGEELAQIIVDFVKDTQ